MALDRAALEGLGRDELIREARRFGVKRPEVMTRVELVDEMLRLGTPSPVERKKVRGWLGVARDLVADLVEQGLNLPDAAALIRGDVKFEPLKPVQPPVATVTLAEIYGAQGHFKKALAILDEVLDQEPDHDAARKLRTRLERERAATRPSTTTEVVASAPSSPPEEPEPLTPRRLSKQPPAIAGDERAELAGTSEEPEPLTPRRLSKQPPAMAVDERAELARAEALRGASGVRGFTPGEDYGGGGRAGMLEDEPLTPRRLSKQPPPMIAPVETRDDPEPLTPRRLSKQPPPDEPEPLTPRRLSKQPPPDEPEPLTSRQLGKEPPPAEPEGTAELAEAGLADGLTVSIAPLDDVAVLARFGPRAVVYFELRDAPANGDAFRVHLAEWRPAAGSAVRVEH